MNAALSFRDPVKAFNLDLFVSINLFEKLMLKILGVPNEILDTLLLSFRVLISNYLMDLFYLVLVSRLALLKLHPISLNAFSFLYHRSWKSNIVKVEVGPQFRAEFLVSY